MRARSLDVVSQDQSRTESENILWVFTCTSFKAGMLNVQYPGQGLPVTWKAGCFLASSTALAQPEMKVFTNKDVNCISVSWMTWPWSWLMLVLIQISRP